MIRLFQTAASVATLALTVSSSAFAAIERGLTAPASTATGTTGDPQAAALAHSLVDAAFPPERREEMMDKLMRTMTDQMKSGIPAALMSDPGLARIMTDYLAQIPAILRPATSAFIPKQMEAVAQAYARMFTVAELRDILAFARTPSGKNYLQRSMDVMSDPAVAAVNSQYFAQAQTLTQASSVALGEKVGAYLKAHPDVARSMATQAIGNHRD
jgi:hypothetical protein